jgi:thymidylate kinase
VICLSGPDGVGKTVHCKRLKEDLVAKKVATKIVWLRQPRLTSYFTIALCILFGISKVRFKATGIRIKHEFHSNKPAAFLWMTTQIIDTFSISFFKIFLPLRLGKTIIVDRWVPDILVDLQTQTESQDIFSSKIFDALFGIMKNAQILILDATVENLLSRTKDDIDETKYLQIRRYFLLLAARCAFPVISTDNDFDTVHQDILRALLIN